jgi:hypothetical protein
VCSVLLLGVSVQTVRVFALQSRVDKLQMEAKSHKYIRERMQGEAEKMFKAQKKQGIK